MLWDDPKDSESTQRLKNMMLYKVPWTNDERDEAMPFIGCLLLLFFIGLGLYALITH